jgi:type II secretory pathway pseudopilin PulG
MAFVMPAYKRGKGFTVIELLTVIGIILFLMAFLTGVFLRYQSTAKVTATKKLIERVGIALERYYADFRAYPPDTGYGQTKECKEGNVNGRNEVLYDVGALWRYLGTEQVKKRTDGSVEKIVGPYEKFHNEELVEYTETNAKYSGQKNYYVVDNWRTPLGYVGDPRRVIHCRGGVDIFSAGPDKKTGIDFGTAGSDNAYNTADDNSDKVFNNAPELGDSAENGTYTQARKTNPKNNPLDDLNNWDPQGK